MNWTLLHKYITGECSPEEVQEVEDWLHTDKSNRDFLNSLEKIWGVEPDDEFNVDSQSAWNDFQYKISESPDQVQENKRETENKWYQYPSRKTYSRSIAMALSAAAVILIALLFTRYTAVISVDTKSQSQLAMQEIMTSRGQQTTFQLSDSTRVKLNADSRIKISRDFEDATRKVYLEGEAYFEVTHNPEKPFIVYSGEASTRVLGTKFGVRAYPEEEETQVVVAEGKVALGYGPDIENNMEITRNQRGVLSKDHEMQVSQVSNIRQYLGWKDGVLVFDDTPLKKVTNHLERWFDVNCTIEDSTLDERRITASFNGEPMEEILIVIALSMDIKYEREGRNITFKKN